MSQVLHKWASRSLWVLCFSTSPMVFFPRNSPRNTDNLPGPKQYHCVFTHPSWREAPFCKPSVEVELGSLISAPQPETIKLGRQFSHMPLSQRRRALAHCNRVRMLGCNWKNFSSLQRYLGFFFSFQNCQVQQYTVEVLHLVCFQPLDWIQTGQRKYSLYSRIQCFHQVLKSNHSIIKQSLAQVF